MDGGIDIDGLVIDLAQPEPFLPKRGFVELRQRFADAPHYLDHVSAGFADGVDGDGRLAVEADGRRRLLGGEPDLGDVADRDPRHGPRRRIAFGPQDHPADVVQALELAHRADHVAPLAFIHVAGGNRGIGLTQHAQDLRYR